MISTRPTSSDIVLVIEVASTSRPKDERRAALSARPGTPEYRLVDLRAAKVPTFAWTTRRTDAVRSECVRGDQIRSTAVDDLVVEATLLLRLTPA